MKKKAKRHNIIIREVNRHNRVLVKDLANILNVSVDTIRRDISELHLEKALIQIHGGAVSHAYNHKVSNAPENVYAFESKNVIVHKALGLINDNSVILMTGGTTNMELARNLPPALKATIFTPAIPIGNILIGHPNIELIFIGGKISKPAQISVGGSAMSVLNEITTDICFMGTGYLHSATGLTDFDWEVVQIKKAMIKASKQLVSLAISEKLDSINRYKICESQQIDTLITELDPRSQKLTSYKKQNISIL